MACKCGSENQKPFPADVKVYFDQARAARHLPVFFPDILMCLDCGHSGSPEDGTNCRPSEEHLRGESSQSVGSVRIETPICMGPGLLFQSCYLPRAEDQR